MSRIYHQAQETGITRSTKGNVTLRRPTESLKVKMALTNNSRQGDLLGEDDSLFIDSFLSQGEIDDVKKMMEDEGGLFDNSGICTSTQMKTFSAKNPPPPLSPIMKETGDSPLSVTSDLKLTNRFEALLGQEEVINCLNKVGPIYHGNDSYSEGLIEHSGFNRFSSPRERRIAAGTRPLDVTIKKTGSRRMQGS